MLRMQILTLTKRPKMLRRFVAGRKACMVHEAGALTSNQTLVKWLPGK